MIGASGILRFSARCARVSAIRGAWAPCTRHEVATAPIRQISSSAVRMHGNHDDHHDHDHDDFVAVGKTKQDNKDTLPPVTHTAFDDLDDDDDEDMVDTVVLGPSGLEYGGPQRGGLLKEPTRFGDWERKGRCTDF